MLDDATRARLDYLQLWLDGDLTYVPADWTPNDGRAALRAALAALAAAEQAQAQAAPVLALSVQRLDACEHWPRERDDEYAALCGQWEAAVMAWRAAREG